VIGFWFRLGTLSDMEYKPDEVYMFERMVNAGVTETWPSIGMPSGGGVMNPGLSIWVFIAYAKLFRIQDPLSATAVVAVLNCMAVLLFLFWGYRHLKSIREKWILMWAISFSLVNPFQILLDRKLWAQSILPIFLVTAFWAWTARKKWFGAFLWGLVGAMVGQIHMSGFFIFFGIFAWTCIYGRPFVWKAWTIGSIVGASLMLPWIRYMLELSHSGGRPFYFQEIYQFLFFRYWASFPWGFKPYGNLGKEAFGQFQTGSVVFLQWGLLIIGVATWIIAAVLFFQRKRSLKQMMKSPQPLFQYQNALFWGAGLVLTIAMVRLHRYYMATFFPFAVMAWVRVLRFNFRKHANVAAVLLWCMLLGYSVKLLSFIHQNKGAVAGDYWISYQNQDPAENQRRDRSRPDPRSSVW